MPLINSILDNDLYKLTMMRAVLEYCPGVQAQYVFNNRRPEGKFNKNFMDSLQFEINKMADLAATDNEITWLRQECQLGDPYLNYLKNYRYDPKEVTIVNKDNELQLRIDGPWERTILWEVPLMAIISELYFLYCDTNWTWNLADQDSKVRNKSGFLSDCRFSDFGTRRRRDFRTQDFVVERMKYWTRFSKTPSFIGTSNVHLAMKNGLRPIGTMAHEWIMGISALEGLNHANRHALRAWSNIYKGHLGIALTDTFGSEAFFADFDGYLSRLFDGVRHDSGDPYKFADRTITHYNKMGIDPMTRVIVFSDGLTAEEAVKIAAYCKNKIACIFGIGTHFTNDFENSKPLNMVIKLAMCNNIPVVKLSDAPTKAIGDRDALRVARYTFFGTPLDNAA